MFYVSVDAFDFVFLRPGGIYGFNLAGWLIWSIKGFVKGLIGGVKPFSNGF